MKFTLHLFAIAVITLGPVACNKVKFQGKGKSASSSSANESETPGDESKPTLTPPADGECNPELQECCDPNDENYDTCMVDCEENGTCPIEEPTPPAEDPDCYDPNGCPVDEPEEPTCEEEGTCPVDPTPTCDATDDYQGKDGECVDGSPTPGQSSENPNQN